MEATERPDEAERVDTEADKGGDVEDERDERSERADRGRDVIGPDDFPDTRLFWRWAAKATRPVVGWVLIGLGVLAILIGWYGVSGESLVAKQMPYLISGGITGMVLVAVGAFFLGTEDLRKELTRLDRVEWQVDELHAVLLSSSGAPKPNGSSGRRRRARADRASTLVALRAGSSYHRPDCQMVAGKETVIGVDGRSIERRGLEPCMLCEPEPAEV